MENKGRILMEKYELGRFLGQGTFAKVYHARSLASGQVVAIKMIDKEKVYKVGMTDQIKREISVMRLVHHPNIVQLYEVMATKTKIYFVMEYVNGGELFNKVAKGRLKEDVARKYFQQLIEAVDFCHSRGVYHRDLKPENLLLDENGNLKVSDFGLSALKESQSRDNLLHTTCGTPAYVAPEIINKKGYDGTKVDIWSCGVILYVLLAGCLPFQDANLMGMYKKIKKGEFRCPPWFSSEVRKLLTRILDPNPSTRITVDKLKENAWFKKEFKSANSRNGMKNSISLPNMQSAYRIDRKAKNDEVDETSELVRPSSLNAFDLISMSEGFNLSGLFTGENVSKTEARFVTQKPASAIVSKLEEIAHKDNFKIVKKASVVKLEGCKDGRKGQLEIDAEIFEVGPSFFLVEVKKTAGDTMEYQKFCNQDLRPSLKDMACTLASCG